MTSDPYDPFSRERELLASGTLDPPENQAPFPFKQKVASALFFVITMYLLTQHDPVYAAGFNLVVASLSIIGMWWVKRRTVVDS